MEAIKRESPAMKRWILSAMMLAAAVGTFPGAAAAGSPAPLLYPGHLYDPARLLAQAEGVPGPAASLDAADGARSPKLAMLYSMILPGLGEYYLGHTGRATAFLVAEGAAWTAFGVFRAEGSHRRSIYKEFAELNAGVAPRSDDDFYRVIGNYQSSDGPFSANEQVRREARAIYPNDRAAQDRYFQDNAYTGGNAWQWGSQEELDRYNGMRKSSLDAFHRSNLTIGLLVANRLLSILDVGILASRSTDDGDHAALSWDVHGAGPEGPGGRLVLNRSF